MTQPATYGEVVRVRVPVAMLPQIHAIGAPVSDVIRDALALYLAHPAVKSQQASSKKDK